MFIWWVLRGCTLFFYRMTGWRSICIPELTLRSEFNQYFSRCIAPRFVIWLVLTEYISVHFITQCLISRGLILSLSLCGWLCRGSTNWDIPDALIHPLHSLIVWSATSHCSFNTIMCSKYAVPLDQHWWVVGIPRHWDSKIKCLPSNIPSRWRVRFLFSRKSSKPSGIPLIVSGMWYVIVYYVNVFWLCWFMCIGSELIVNWLFSETSGIVLKDDFKMFFHVHC